MIGILRRVFLIVLLISLVFVVGAGVWFYQRVRGSFPQLDGVIPVAGLGAQVAVRRDARGVPHLRARSLSDLLFAQGYVTAQDRLWQMDLNRRLAEGELSEIFGERTLRLDIQNRTLGLRHACERAAAGLDPASREYLAAYARGINAFIATHLDRLPLEFLLLRYQPRPWREMDSFAVAANMMQILNTTWPDALMRERIHSKVGAEFYADLFPDRSPLDHPVAEVPATSRPAVSHRVARSGSFLRQAQDGERSRTVTPRPFSVSSRRAAEFLENETPRYLSFPLGAGLGPNSTTAVPSDVAALVGAIQASPLPGSNNWVVSGLHTQSGKPLLANDPHLGHSIPSVWYMIHLKAPGLNVSGVSLPGLPLVVIGHNERIAWGMTNTGPAVQDLYVESFNFRDPTQYLHNGAWVEADVRVEDIKVRKASDYRLTVKATRHGPVVSHDGDRDLALQWTALEPHALTFSFLKLDQAGNWGEFKDALRSFSGPMQNFVYADAQGSIGYYAAGWVPIRKQGDGSLPSPGSTDDYDWTGYIPFEHLPQAYNPPSGIIATANGRVIPDVYPYFITNRWDAPYRTARIYQLLGEGKSSAVADMLRIQMDIVSLQDEWLAARLLAASSHFPPQGAEAQYALNLLRRWDGEAQSDSASTLVCEVTRQALLERLLKPHLDESLLGYHWPMSGVFVANAIDNNWTRWLPPGDASFDDTLMKSLEEGVGRIPELVHSRSHEAWKWGDTILLTFHHPLSGGFPFLGRLLDVGPFPQAGMGTTVKQTTPTLGPSMRMVVDFSDFDSSVQNITLGESGEVFSPYYRDQFDAWYQGRSYPMLFSDAAVDKGTAHKLTLEPAGK